ncbi:MAG: hypothetical protein KY476_19305 [Planctomycetes bacterium]|nr:hypothetical protein [Planctomycetota bacterium]
MVPPSQRQRLRFHHLDAILTWLNGVGGMALVPDLHPRLADRCSADVREQARHFLTFWGDRMIIWSGWGFLVAIIGFGCLVATEVIVEGAFRDDQYYQAHGWPKMVAFTIAAVIVGVVGRGLQRRQGKVLVDPATGREVVVSRGNTFFFIPMEYWAPIFLVLGIIFLFVTE